MRSQKKSVMLLVGSIGLVVMLMLFGPAGLTGTARAQGNSVQDILLVTFTDTAPVQYTDLSGTVIGEGLHVGELLCIGDICNQKIEFEPLSTGSTTDPLVYEYKFKSMLAFDTSVERVVVSGTGTISSGGPKTKFTFTGVFQNNGNGTVQVTYMASTAEASFSIPAAPASFSVFSNQ